MSSVNTSTIETFFSRHTALQYKKGDIIIRAGDTPSGALYLRSGFIRMSYTTDAGDMLVLHVFTPGSMLPMPWIINDTPNRYYFEALTPVDVWRAPREHVLEFFHDHPDVEHALLSRMMHGFSGLMRRMEFLVFDSAYKKTVLLLLHYVKHFSDVKKKGTLQLLLTHREIAAWIGTTRETASLQIEILKKKKLIAYDRRTITVPNVALLEGEIDSAVDLS